MNRFRVIDSTEGFILLAITLIFVAIIAVKLLQRPVVIVLVTVLYGAAFCASIIYIFGEKFTGIVFILVSWVFIAIAVISGIVVLLQWRKRR